MEIQNQIPNSMTSEDVRNQDNQYLSSQAKPIIAQLIADLIKNKPLNPVNYLINISLDSIDDS